MRNEILCLHEQSKISLSAKRMKKILLFTLLLSAIILPKGLFGQSHINARRIDQTQHHTRAPIIDPIVTLENNSITIEPTYCTEIKVEIEDNENNVVYNSNALCIDYARNYDIDITSLTNGHYTIYISIGSLLYEGEFEITH
jgi:hypothetical protein